MYVHAMPNVNLFVLHFFELSHINIFSVTAYLHKLHNYATFKHEQILCFEKLK